MTHFESYFQVSEKLFYCWVQDTTNNTIALFFYIETAMTTTALFWHGLKLSPLFSFPQRPLALITVKRKEQCSSNVMDEVFVVSGIIKLRLSAQAKNTSQDLDYSRYHKINCTSYPVRKQILGTTLMYIIIHSKYFPSSDWLKAHA